MDEARPLAAFAVTLTGGLLIFVEGVILAAAAGIASSAGFLGAGSLLGGLGLLGGLYGFVVVVLAVQLYRHPEGHRGYSAAILAVSILSILGGGGFLLGLALGITGAILGFLFTPEEAVLPWEQGALLPGTRAGLASAQCWRCETPLPIGSTKCPNCGVAVIAA